MLVMGLARLVLVHRSMLTCIRWVYECKPSNGRWHAGLCWFGRFL